jgi:hypothetical protein
VIFTARGDGPGARNLEAIPLAVVEVALKLVGCCVNQVVRRLSKPGFAAGQEGVERLRQRPRLYVRRLSTLAEV